MTEYIENVPIASVQDVIFTDSEETEEIDLIDKDENIVLKGSDQGKEIEISFTLVKNAHPERLSFEEQRSETKDLISNDVEDNYFKYEDSEYFLSIGSISIPETSELQTIREGTINAQALPWPKHYPEARTGNNKRNSGDIGYFLNVEADGFSASLFPVANLDYALSFESLPDLIKDVEGSLSMALNVDSITDKLISTSSMVDYSLDFEDIMADMKYSSVGVIQYELFIEGQSVKQRSMDGESVFSLDLQGDFQPMLGGPFGRYFGTRFGGT